MRQKNLWKLFDFGLLWSLPCEIELRNFFWRDNRKISLEKREHYSPASLKVLLCTPQPATTHSGTMEQKHAKYYKKSLLTKTSYKAQGRRNRGAQGALGLPFFGFELPFPKI